MSTRTAKALVVLLAVLSWIGCSRVATDAGENTKRIADALMFVHRGMNTALAKFKEHSGRYPTTEEGLAALFVCPPDLENRWLGPYIELPKVPIDPWQRPYQYRFPAAKTTQSYDIWSLGPDGVPSDDDIGNWKN